MVLSEASGSQQDVVDLDLQIKTQLNIKNGFTIKMYEKALLVPKQKGLESPFSSKIITNVTLKRPTQDKMLS